jgi:hypothetical protein
VSTPLKDARKDSLDGKLRFWVKKGGFLLRVTVPEPVNEHTRQFTLLLHYRRICGMSREVHDSNGDHCMLGYHNCACLILLLVFAAGCSDSQAPEKSDSAGPAARNPEPAAGGLAESAVLREEMIVVALEVMGIQDPSADPNMVRYEVEKAIVEIREHCPEFLIVPAETEEKLRADAPIQDSAKRIAVAEGFFREFGIPVSGLAKSLLPAHKAGWLTPVRTELLAQLMVADMKKAEDALTK